MINTSGFAWNDVKKCVEVDSDDAWQTYVQVHILFYLYISVDPKNYQAYVARRPSN